MRESIVLLADLADVAIARCVPVLSGEDLEPIAASLANVRLRLSYPDDLIVVALAGGTGSGKSSLFNALAGEELADVGGVRPTTGEPLATVPVERMPAVSGYLERIGVHRCVGAALPDWLCLVDLPDTDSVETDHRIRVEALLPRLDVIVWVLDPEKYRDAVLHHGYLQPLSRYAGQFVFVLNQTDRLTTDEAKAVESDLAAALRDDGIEEAAIVLCSAAPVAGPPLGVDDLSAVLENIAVERSGVYRKLLLDLEEATRRLLRLTGGESVRFEDRARSAVAEALSSLSRSDLAAATQRLNQMVGDLIADVGTVTSQRLATVAPGIPGAVHRAADDSGEAERILITEIVAPLRAILRKRAEANAALTDLGLALSSQTRV